MPQSRLAFQSAVTPSCGGQSLKRLLHFTQSSHNAVIAMNTEPLSEGIVCYWQDDRGFGFVSTDKAERLFFHIRDFKQPQVRRPQQGDKLKFRLALDKQLRCYAMPVQLECSAITPAKLANIVVPDYAQILARAWYFRYLFFALLLLSLLADRFAVTLPLFYLEASLFTYWLYQIDKKLACSGHPSRLPEESLQMFSLIGGWPGALIAQKLLHHKVHKTPFQREFRFVIYGNSCFLLWLVSESGSAFLQNLAMH